MNRILFTLIIITTLTTTVVAQSLKVSSVDASEPRQYDKLSKALGKTLILTFYDNSVSVNSPGENGTLNLRKSTETEYVKVEKTSYKNSTYTLKVNKTFGVITSVTLNFSYQKNNQTNESGWSTLTAKRF